MTTLERIRTQYEQWRGRQQEARNNLQKLQDAHKSLSQKAGHLEQARATVQEVARQTQSELEYRLNELVSLCLQSVFDDPMQLAVRFVNRRGRTECDIGLLDKHTGELDNPLDDCGHGVSDIAAFGLRLATRSLIPNNRPLLILDEPFRNLNDPTRRSHQRMAQMMREIVDRLGLQVVMVTLTPEFMDVADTIFDVKRENGVSVVTNR